MAEETNKYILYGGPVDVDPAGVVRSMGEYIIRGMTEQIDRIQWINGLTDEKRYGNYFLENSMRLANCLKQAGVQSDDIIAIVSENRFEFAIVVCATYILGAILAPINLTYSERELDHAINLSRPKFIFVSPNAAEKVMNIVKLPKNRDFIKQIYLFADKYNSEDKVVMYNDLMNDLRIPKNQNIIPEPVDIKDKVGIILCSSGTTGLPKGVMITHENMLFSLNLIRNAPLVATNSTYEDLTLFGAAPWFHTYGFFRMLSSLTNPHRFVFLSRFQERPFLDCIQKYKISMIILVPPLMVFLAKHPLVDEYDLSSLKHIYCGAAALGKEVEEAVKARIGVRSIKQGYGLSEATLGVVRQSDTKMKPGSIGGLLSGMWSKVINPETGEILGPNQVGEFCFKGPLIMKGYINNELATREAIRNGWLHTGDIGYYDDDNEFFIVDRLKELIKYKGFQVPPAELEAILLSHTKIKDAAVIGIPDEVAGELPLAFVVRFPNVEVSEQEIIDFAAAQTSAAKKLRGGVRFVDEIPKNASGKILRRILRDRFKNELKSKL